MLWFTAHTQEKRSGRLRCLGQCQTDSSLYTGSLMMCSAGTCLKAFQAEDPKWQYISIFRGYVHFEQMMRHRKSKSAKFRSRWSKVTRVLGPLDRVMAILVAQPATTGGSCQGENGPKWQ